jgi:LCP family protein required for cell wall assembly
MRTTLKRGIGRGAAVNGNGRAVLPPAVSEPLPATVKRYQQPPPPRRGVGHVVARVLVWVAAAIVVTGAGAAGGLYLYAHESLSDTVATSPDVVEAQEKLDVALPGEPAIALIIGYDKRAGVEAAFEARSDTVMLVRTDPGAKAVSMLSFPRDLIVDVHCPGRSPFRGKINEAYTICGAKGTLETVRQLTDLPINYLMTVNFRGFKQIVAKLGGVWIDVDRRYFNDNTIGYDRYATIDLQPGYQKLNGSQALDFVRYRHSDSDLYRIARQQQFVKAFNEAVTTGLSPLKVPKIVNIVTDNVEIGVAGGKALSLKTVTSYALLAYELPAGHFFQTKIEGVTGYAELAADTTAIQAAVREFASPDVEAPLKATDVAIGRKRKSEAPPPAETTITVLNGNGLDGSAANASYQLAKHGYRMLVPPNGAPANAPSFDYVNSKVYFDPAQERSKLAARKVADVFGDADVVKSTPGIAALSSGATLVVVVGLSFDGTLAPVPVDRTPTKQEAAVRNDPSVSLSLIQETQRQVGFPLLVPAVLDRTSYPARSVPIRAYKVAGHRAVRLVFDTGANEFWGVQMTSWDDAPALKDPNEVVKLKGRRYELHYDGPHLHMVVLRHRGATYWVVNTVLNRLSNETMLAVAKGLTPLSQIQS